MPCSYMPESSGRALAHASPSLQQAFTNNVAVVVVNALVHGSFNAVNEDPVKKKEIAF